MSELSHVNEYELPHPPDDVEATVHALRYIESAGQIDLQRDSAGRPYVPSQCWSMDHDTRKTFFIGNGHGDIVRFLPVMQRLQNPVLPITIVNFDRHVDDKPYVGDAHLYSSWQQYLHQVRHVTNTLSSYNIEPTGVVTQISPVTTQLSIEAFRALPEGRRWDVLSVDLDVLNGYMPQELGAPVKTPIRLVERGVLIQRTIKETVPLAESVMAFVSPDFSNHGFEQNVLRDLFTTAIQTPIDPRAFLKI